MKKTVFMSCLCCPLIVSVTEAIACGSCMYVHFDRILPPVMGWVALSVLSKLTGIGYLQTRRLKNGKEIGNVWRIENLTTAKVVNEKRE